MNIVVLAGGLSPERNVSLVSGGLIAQSLAKTGNRVFLADVYEGAEIPKAGISALFSDSYVFTGKVEEAEPDLDKIRETVGRDDLIGPGILEICKYADVVFLALHGAIGENGQLQATLDNYGIRHYTGSGYTGSLLAMNKGISKIMFRHYGVTTADWITVKASESAPTERIIREVGLPCVIKPVSCGSSCGVSIVETSGQLDEALRTAFEYDPEIIAEKKITGREFACGILDGKVLPPIEIIPIKGFYDYKNKYLPNMTREICPADLTGSELAQISEATSKAFRALQLQGYARADFILSEDDGRFYCLEVNTLPGMTPTSLMPQEAAAAGISYDELCMKLVTLAKNK